MKFIAFLLFIYGVTVLSTSPSDGSLLRRALDEDSCEDSTECPDNGCKKQKKPNIVIVLSCSVGWSDVSWNYPAVHTPNMESLAREGVILNQTYVQTMCSPTRAALLTGYYPFRAGLGRATIFPQQPAYLRRNFTTLAEALKPLGYATHMLGKWHLGACRWDVTPLYRGFDSFYGTLEYYMDYYSHKTVWANENSSFFGIGPSYNSFYDNTGMVLNQEGKHAAEMYNERAVNIISRHNTDAPLFLYDTSMASHFAHEAIDRFLDLYPDIEDPYVRADRAFMSLLDETIGNITNALKDKGMWENTVFLFLSGHGINGASGRNWPWRSGIGTTFESAIRVPAFMGGKLLEKTGYVNNEVIHVTDFFTTFLSLAGGIPDPNLDGINVWDTLSKGKPTPRKETLQHLDVHPDSYHYVMRVGDYKLMDGQWNIMYRLPLSGTSFVTNRIDSWYPPIDLKNPDVPDVPGSPFPFNTTFLFNIAEDPRETTDLSESMPEKVEELRLAAQKYIKSAPPTFFPELDFDSGDPANHDGLFSPGWC
ncbi:arylsulfatase B-like [Glandiceps talaboti]